MRLSTLDNIKRLGIFVFYDKQGHASECVKYFLNDLISNLSKLIIVSNGDIDYETVVYFEKLTDYVYVRENSGLDAAAYQAGILIYEGWESLKEYDEVVLINDTCYGPVFPFANVFLEMNQRDLDFWGISAGYKSVDGWNALPQGYIPDHIQTFFVAFRKEMLASREFFEYWTNYNNNWNTFVDVVTKHELIMTEYFAEKGFTWDVFVDIGAYRSNCLIKNYNLNAYSSYEMLQDCHSPFIKRKTFLLDRKERLYMAGGEDVNKAVSFIENQKNYNTDLIYEDLLRNHNVKEIYDSMNMNYVLSSSEMEDENEINSQCLIVIYCGSVKRIEKLVPYLKALNNKFDIIILLSATEDCDKVNEKLEEKQIVILNTIKVPAFAVGISALWLIGEQIKKYEYLCFTHDAEYYWGDGVDTIYDSIFYTLQENTIKSANYVKHCLNLLKQNSKIGLLETPFALHNKYFNSLQNFWETDFENIMKLSLTLRLKCHLDFTQTGISRGGGFICKTSVLSPVLEWNITEKDYLENGLFSYVTPIQWEKILPYIAQHSGYLSGIVMSEEFASIHITTLKYYLENTLAKLAPLVGNSDLSFSSFLDQISGEILHFKTIRDDEKTESIVLENMKLQRIVEEKEAVIRELFPLTSLKMQLRLRLKKHLPRPLYRLCVCLKRIIFGPRGVQFNYVD